MSFFFLGIGCSRNLWWKAFGKTGIAFYKLQSEDAVGMYCISSETVAALWEQPWMDTISSPESCTDLRPEAQVFYLHGPWTHVIALSLVSLWPGLLLFLTGLSGLTWTTFIMSEVHCTDEETSYYHHVALLKSCGTVSWSVRVQLWPSAPGLLSFMEQPCSWVPMLPPSTKSICGGQTSDTTTSA